LLAALPNIEIIQPCNSLETEMVVDYCINQSIKSCVIRMNISPSPRNIQLPARYNLSPGKGITVNEGTDAIIITYGPVMLNEALKASEILAENDFSLKVVNMPWLNLVDFKWLENLLFDHTRIFILEDHAPSGGLGDFLIRRLLQTNILNNKHIKIFSVEGFPACGNPLEALRFHGLDGESLATSIKSYDHDKQSN
jgi:transketolase